MDVIDDAKDVGKDLKKKGKELSDKAKAKAKELRDEERASTWNVILVIVGLIMILVIFDLWFVVKEDQDRITPYYLALTKEQKEKE